MAACGDNTVTNSPTTPAAIATPTIAPATTAAPTANVVAITETLVPAETLITTPIVNRSTPMTDAPDQNEVVRKAIEAAIQKQFGTAADMLEFKSFDLQQWPDTALGCPKAGFFYQQVITPGYQVTVTDKARNVTYDYRTSLRTGNVVLCDNKKP